MIEKVLITDTGVIDGIREAMPDATIKEKGLLPEGYIGRFSVAKNFLLAQGIGSLTIFSFSALLSVSISTGGPSSLYFISANRTTGSNQSAVRVKVLSGSYSLPIVFKDSGNAFYMYLKRTQYTPVVGLYVMANSSPKNLLPQLSAVEDEEELEGTTEATLEG